MQRLTALTALLFLGIGHATAGDDGFKPMFNGKDLTGWHNVNCAPGTFYVKDNMIITTGKPTGYLRTDKHYENFIAEFDWFHAPSPKGSVGNSGFFVWCDPLPALGTGYTRGIEVQVLVNLTYKNKKGEVTHTSQGDLFSIWGATCKPDRPHPIPNEMRCLPSENHCKGEFEWNHYKVVANDGVIKLSVNGHEVSGVSKCNPRKGYLALESEGSECRFKNLKIKELPSTNPKPNEICEVDKGWKCMFNGLDFSGWKMNDDEKKHWKITDGVVTCDGKGGLLRAGVIKTEKSFGDFEIICDYDTGNAPADNFMLYARDLKSSPSWQQDKKGWNRVVARLQGENYKVKYNGKPWMDALRQKGIPANGPVGFVSDGIPVRIRNAFIRELKRDD